jgi:predicted 3-demethylubiquinone-9 3-methyltransferase (glyoxalase superfamily)
VICLTLQHNQQNKIMTEPIYTCLWFDGQAKAAADFYCSVFKNSSILSENPMVVMFELNGRKFMGLNGGPQFKPNEAISLVVSCASQKDIDHYWTTLTANGGAESMCGWLFMADRAFYAW